MGTKIFTIILALLVVSSFSLFAAPKEANYVGSAKCKTCHNADKNGAQYKIWESKAHAKAYADLKTDAAKAKAKAAGIEDPLKSEKCLSCHTTAAGKKNVDASYDITEGVGCESCHGPGSEYKKMSTMKDKKAAMEAGLVEAGEKTCATCHIKDNPGHKGKFGKYADEYAKIAHPVPAENDRRK